MYTFYNPQKLLSQPEIVNTSLFAVASFTANVAAEDWPTEKGVVVLDPKNFESFIDSQDYTIIEFYAPWCGHCKSLEPEWATAASKVSKLKPKVLLAKVDADAHKELATKYDVSGYPTIKIFKKGTKKPEDYDGPREAKGIVSFVKEAMGLTGGAGSVTKLKTVDEAKAVVSDYALVGLFREPVSASSMYKIFTEVASELPFYTDKKVSVAYSASYAKDPIAEALGIKTVPALLVYKPGQEQPASMTIPRDRKLFTEELLTEFVQKQLE